MIRKKTLLKKMDYLSDNINKLQAQIHDIKYPNGNLYVSYDPFGGIRYLNYSCTYNDEIVNVNVCMDSYGLREYKFTRNNDRTFIGTKIMINDELVEKYYVVDLYKKIAVETTNIEQLNKTEWTDKIA